MKILLCLVSPDRDTVTFFGSEKERIIPRDALHRGVYAQCSIVTAAWVMERDSERRFGDFLIDKASAAEACLLLVDSRSGDLVKNCENAALIFHFDHSDIRSSKLNFFHKLISSALRAFAQLLHRKDRAPLWMLPLRNFSGNDLQELARVCREEVFNATFPNELDANLSGLNSRVRPRRKSSYKTRYVVDDRRRFFVYGHEHHSKLGTAPPHTSYCVLAGRFRFGIRVDDSRHFNVSEGEGDTTTISGTFLNCHDEELDVPGSDTHLNMFCNDFFGDSAQK